MNSPARPHANRRPQPLRLAAALALAGLLAPVTPGTAATLEVSNVPVSIGTAPKPNIMFILDDSGSMTWDYMPDDLDPNDNGSSKRIYGGRSSHCNGVAFNPDIEYPLPVKIDSSGGTITRSTYPNVSLTAAPKDGFNPTSGTPVNLSTDSNANFYYIYSGTQPHLSWTYSSSGSVDTSTTFYKECMSSDQPIYDNKGKLLATGAAPGLGVFTKVLVSSLSTTQQQQYANWYSYYRTRQLTMRSAAGLVFDKMTDASRIGFTTISETGVAQNTKFLDVTDFTLTQKYDFFTRLYIGEAGGTPLRASLAKVGRYYGNHFTGQKDPVQYSCQRNFAILSTDGYWNTTGENTNYGPFLLGTNTKVDQQDGSEARPMKDSASGGTGSSNSLADVAEYYWATDLRPNMANNVAPLASDPATYQHLNTYTIGLGLRGTLSYSPDYLTTPANSDYAALISGTKNWPIPSGTLGSSENATHIDDLWHAAVNGRGQYFSVGNSVELTSALVTALDNINDRTATGSAAAISAQAPVQTDRWIFIANYTSPAWTGDVRAFQFSINTDGSLSVPDTAPGKESWSAAKQLDKRNLATAPRAIYFNSGGAKAALTDFTYANLQTAGLSGSFDNRCALAGQTPARTTSERLSQCATMSSAAQNNVSGSNLVDYLRGSRSNETSAATSANRLYRKRSSLLGDIINASPVYVGKPPFLYADAGYASFAAAKAGRTKVVYAAANDGMLHAFRVEDASGNPSGDELWAFVPTAVIPDLWNLADDAYKSRHRYYIDVTPTLADVYDGSAWHTILVGGFGAGGRGYYALDVTTPESPKLLWEFSGSGDEAVGLSFGMPIVTKNSKGTWVATLASGVNNVAPGDGIGRVYVLNALTGALISTTQTCNAGTCQGDTTTPSNLVHLNAWTNSPYDNTTLRYYGGDMLGNMWRFDPDGTLGSAGSGALLLGQALSPDGKVQPISTKPILTEIRPDNRKVALVSFGTGRLLNLGDVADTTVQSIYTVRDALNNKSLGTLRDALTPLKLNASTRLLSATQTINWSDPSINGWYFDLDATGSAGERTVINGVSVHGVLGIASMKPTSDICQGGGSSYLYLIDLGSGTVISADASNEMITGLGVVVNSGGDAVLATTASGGLQTKVAPPPTSSYSISMKRTAWRELVD